MIKIELQHFKAFNDASPIALDNPGVKNILLYGENGSGKSSIFEALRYVFFKDEIEKVDPLLPPAEKAALIDAIRSKYNSRQNIIPFSIKINNQDYSSFLITDYQAFFLNRFERMESLSIIRILEHLPMPESDIHQFVEISWEMIKEDVNHNLRDYFHEPYEISVGDKAQGYDITIKNTLTNLSRSNELNRFFNEAIINLIQLLIWFASVQLMLDKSKKRLIVLDDFITSLDAANRTYLIRYLMEKFKEEQLVILTHDFSFYNVTSYIITQIERMDSKWAFKKLYLIGDEHRIEDIRKINIKRLRKEFNSTTCNLNDLGNQIRKCFEELLHELASRLTVGNLEETCDIINRIGQSKDIYWKPNHSLHDLISQIETIILTTSDTQVKSKLQQSIDEYKLTNINVLQDTIKKLKLYQKVSMHPLSHGVLGVPHFQQKDVEQSLILLEKLNDCVHSIIDGKI